VRIPVFIAVLIAVLGAGGCKVEKSSGEPLAARTAPDTITSTKSGSTPTDSAVNAPGQTGFATGTPAGALPDWITEVKKGIADLPALSQKDPAGAQKRALDLYLTRQEYIEMYWSAARLPTTPALSQAVKDAETRFHELLGLVGPSSKAGRARVKAAVKALDAQYDVVLREARRGNVKMNPTEVFGSPEKAKNQ
jgi:hypothetical protein